MRKLGSRSFHWWHLNGWSWQCCILSSNNLLFHFTHVILFLFLDWVRVALGFQWKCFCMWILCIYANIWLICSCLQYSYLQHYLLELSHIANTKEPCGLSRKKIIFKCFYSQKYLFWTSSISDFFYFLSVIMCAFIFQQSPSSTCCSIAHCLSFYVSDSIINYFWFFSPAWISTLAELLQLCPLPAACGTEHWFWHDYFIFPF